MARASPDPPEEQLARDFGVSRMTANKAIRDLVQKGYLTRQPGLGTFVTDRKAESSLVEVYNIADEVRFRGTITVIKYSYVKPLKLMTKSLYG